MALFQKKQFIDLANEEGEYCISLYVPTRRIGENKESRLTLKNQISSVEKELAGIGLKGKEVNEYLNPLKEIINDSSFWRHLSDTLVIFRSRKTMFSKNLPIQTDEFSLVSRRFYVLPLIDMFNREDAYFILLLSLNKNKLFQASRNEITEIYTGDIFPGDVTDAAGRDVRQKSVQPRGEQTGDGFPLFHGKGEGKDDKGTEMYKYLRDINHGMSTLLEGYSVPLVVASTEEIFSKFREVCSYKHIYPRHVPGNFDHEDILLVHDEANVLLESYFDQGKNQKKKKYLEAPDQKILSKTGEVIKASFAGQIETLFVEKGRVLWGSYDEETGEVEMREDKKPLDHCLLDTASRNTFLKGGEVFIEEISDLPESGFPLNAVLRFPG